MTETKFDYYLNRRRSADAEPLTRAQLAAILAEQEAVWQAALDEFLERIERIARRLEEGAR